MHDVVRNRTSRARTRPPFECIALLLQGGGALGAYQAGVYQALAEADLHPARERPSLMFSAVHESYGTHPGSAAMSAIRSLSGEKRTLSKALLVGA